MDYVNMDIGMMKQQLDELHYTEGIDTVALPRDEFNRLNQKLADYMGHRMLFQLSKERFQDRILFYGVSIYPTDEIEDGWEPDGQEVGFEENNDPFETFDPEMFAAVLEMLSQKTKE